MSNDKNTTKTLKQEYDEINAYLDFSLNSLEPKRKAFEKAKKEIDRCANVASMIFDYFAKVHYDGSRKISTCFRSEYNYGIGSEEELEELQKYIDMHAPEKIRVSFDQNHGLIAELI